MDWNDAWDAAGEALKNDQETIFEMSVQLAQLKAENEQLHELWMDFLYCHKLTADGEVEIPEELSATLDIGLPLAGRIVEVLRGEKSGNF